MNLNIFFSLNIPHLSAYHLTIEEGTVFGVYKKKGKIKEIDENLSLLLFETLINTAEKYNFQHYEISNFAKENYIAQHNFSYWTGEQYLGVGASAHSFDGSSRKWNISNIEKYISSLQNDNLQFEVEYLTEKEKYNEYILTGLRTYNGLNISELNTKYFKFYKQIKTELTNYLKQGFIIEQNGFLILTKSGKFISDSIMSDLIIL